MWKSLVNLMLGGLLLGMTVGVAAQEEASSEPPSSLSKSMEWQMIPGESLNALSRLFYPKSGAMQRIFVKSTLDLNRDERPDLTADYKFEEKTAITIPTLIELSRHAPRVTAPRSAPSNPDDTTVSISTTGTTTTEKPAKKLTKKQQDELQALEQRSEDRKKELDDLNARLKSLEDQTKSQDAAIKETDQKIKDTQAKSSAPAQLGN